MMPLNPAQVDRLIREAFSSVLQPHGYDIAPHQCPECEDVRNRLSPYTFENVPGETLDWLSDSLPLLGPEGLHYYLPAYLLRALSDPKWWGLDHLLYHLAPSATDFKERGEYWLDRLSVFSSTQRKAVLAFISWLAATDTGRDYPDEIQRAKLIWSRVGRLPLAETGTVTDA